MADLKILRGKENNLPTTKEDGTIYFCTDSKNLFIDYKNDQGNIERAHINNDSLYGIEDDKFTYPNNAIKKGNALKPLYIDENGRFQECDKYSGGTLVTLNDTDRNGIKAAFYAPEHHGSIGQILSSRGGSDITQEPKWIYQSELSVGSASKLTPGANIALTTGATGTATKFDGSSDISIPVTDIKESYITWGGTHLTGAISPIDAAASSLHSANRFAFAKPNGITIEYLTNGAVWTSYGDNANATYKANKINLVSGIGAAFTIGNTSGAGNNTALHKVRITLNATNMGVYTRLQKLLININTNYASGSNVIVEKAMKDNETAFSPFGTYNLEGNPGWNSIPIGAAFGGDSTETTNIAALRLTFGITGVNNTKNSALTVLDIIGIGETYQEFPSNMSKTGHLYSWDANQNMIFPKGLYFPVQKNKTPYIGGCTNSTDDTFVVGSLTGTKYDTGLAIGGTSGNLLWKGVRVATVDDLPIVNNGTLNIKVNGTSKGTFTANQSGDTIVELTESDTKNTAGSTNTSSKIFLIGATSQAANPKTYSHDTAYVGADGYLYSNNEKVDPRIFTTLIPTGTQITSSSSSPVDLNTVDYLKVGRYFCSQTAQAATIKNCPVSVAFMMEVYAPLSTTIDNETTSKWVYRIRKITAYNTGVQYIQYCSVGSTVNSWTYDPWYIVPRSKFTQNANGANGGSATLGSATQPVYVAADGTLTACTTYAGGTKVTLNGADKGGSTASFYAPTNSAARTGHIVAWSGGPAWVDPLEVTVGASQGLQITGSTNTVKAQVFDSTYTYLTTSNSTKVMVDQAVNSTYTTYLGSADKGSTTKPIYLTKGIPAEGSTYAGGTALVLNGKNKSGSNATIWAPTVNGASNAILIGGDSTNTGPVWSAGTNALAALGIVSYYGVAVSFTNGVGYYDSEHVVPNTLVLAQRRSSQVDHGILFSTHSETGRVKLCGPSSLNGTINVHLAMFNR